MHPTTLLLALFALVPQETTLRSRPIRIHRETTYLTEPLDESGHVDYVEALNQRYNQCSSDTNANAALREVMGTGDVDESLSEAGYFQMLGLPVEQAEPRFVDFYEFAKTTGFDRQQLFTQSREISRRPWDVNEYAFSADWLSANSRALRGLREAARRTDWFEPLGPTGKRLLQVYTPQDSRTAVRLFAASAMFKIGSGDHSKVWEDIIACARLGSHVGQGSTTVEGLVGYLGNHYARAAEFAFLSKVRAPPTVMERYRVELKAVRPPKTMAARVAESERFAFLDVVCAMQRGEDVSEVFDNPLPAHIKAMKEADIDFNAVLQAGNAWFDHTAAVMAKPPGPERTRQLDVVLKELGEKAIGVEAAEPNVFAGDDSAERFAATAIALMYRVPGKGFAPVGLRQILDAEDLSVASSRLSEIAWELHSYRREHSKYPQSLDELERDEFKLPLDPFSGQHFVYSLDTEDGCLVYSVGANRSDDGGTDPARGVENHDYVVRLAK